MSDVYAMGARPISALSIVGFPIDELDGEVLERLLLGGTETLEEAGCPLIGGHSINDEEIKCGFAVTGLLEAGQAVERNAARPGHVLVITKPVGTGMVAFGAQIGRIRKQCLDEVGASMAELNRDAAELMVKHEASACTDVTGFGLAGHLVEMARGSGVTAEIDLSRLPVFGAVKACIDEQIIPGAIERNQEYSMAWVKNLDEANEASLPVLFDPQTSGGLLIALPEDRARDYVDEMKGLGHHATSIIGRIKEKDPALEDGQVVVTRAELKHFTGTVDAVLPKSEADPDSAPKAGIPVAEPVPAPMADDDEPCCANPPIFDDEDETPAATPTQAAATKAPLPIASDPDHPTSDAMPHFMDFMSQAGKEGALDARTKKMIWLALSVGFRCDPCTKSHLKSAIDMGFTKEQIEEAASLGIAFGGCSAMLMYREICKKAGI